MCLTYHKFKVDCSEKKNIKSKDFYKGQGLQMQNQERKKVEQRNSHYHLRRGRNYQ